ncbi:MAG: hypothetical protein ACYCZO_16800, partial [Daejeonella sp.]
CFIHVLISVNNIKSTMGVIKLARPGIATNLSVNSEGILNYTPQFIKSTPKGAPGRNKIMMPGKPEVHILCLIRGALVFNQKRCFRVRVG